MNQLIQTSPLGDSITGIKNALSFTALSLKSGALDERNAALVDQAEAILKTALDNLKEQQPLPPEFGFHLVTAINELERCQKLCSGNLRDSVFDVTVRLETIRGDL